MTNVCCSVYLSCGIEVIAIQKGNIYLSDEQYLVERVCDLASSEEADSINNDIAFNEGRKNISKNDNLFIYFSTKEFINKYLPDKKYELEKYRSSIEKILSIKDSEEVNIKCLTYLTNEMKANLVQKIDKIKNKKDIKSTTDTLTQFDFSKYLPYQSDILFFSKNIKANNILKYYISGTTIANILTESQKEIPVLDNIEDQFVFVINNINSDGMNIIPQFSLGYIYKNSKTTELPFINLIKFLIGADINTDLSKEEIASFNMFYENNNDKKYKLAYASYSPLVAIGEKDSCSYLLRTGQGFSATLQDKLPNESFNNDITLFLNFENLGQNIIDIIYETRETRLINSGKDAVNKIKPFIDILLKRFKNTIIKLDVKEDKLIGDLTI